MWFFIGSLLSGVMEGGGGISVTRLTTACAATGNLTVASTEGFLKSGYVVVESEKIRYTNKTTTAPIQFIVAATGRGWDNTQASTHSSGTKVYSPEASVLNYALGFDVVATGTTAGAMYIPAILYSFFFVTLPRMILWDYSWLKASEWLQLLRYTFMVISIGFLVYMAYTIASALGGILQSIFTRP